MAEANTRAPKIRAQTNTILSEETLNLESEHFEPQPNNAHNYEPNQERAVALKSDTALTDMTELREKVNSMILFTETAAPDGKKGSARECKVCGKEESRQTISHHFEANHI